MMVDPASPRKQANWDEVRSSGPIDLGNLIIDAAPYAGQTCQNRSNFGGNCAPEDAELQPPDP